MSSPPIIEAKVTFLSSQDGGRILPALDDQRYRPHLVVGDPNQRLAVTAEDKRTIIEDYLGISFSGQGEPLLPDQAYDVRLKLLYYPYAGYDALITGSTFTLREGARIVGFGCVRKGVEDAAA